MGSTLKHFVRSGAAALLCAAAGWVHATAGPVQAEVPGPQRIVSLLPSATEAVCALGACARLVGVDAFSEDPPWVRGLPKLGRTWQPDIERIVQLRPDLVLAGRGPAQQRLQAAGLPVLVVDATTLQQVRAALEQIDAALGQQRAGALWQRLQERLQALAQDALQQRHGRAAPRVYIEVDAAMYAAAPQSFMGELLHLLGAGNIAPADAAHFPRISPEYVRRADPDLIIQTYAASVRDLAQRPGWAQLRAVRQGQVCQLNASESRVLTRPGPRLDIAAAVLARCLRAPQGDAAALIHQWEQLP